MALAPACGGSLDTSVFDAACPPSCPPPSPGCGDGQLGDRETCDDANQLSEDGCSWACTVEPGYACDGEPSLCMPATPRLDAGGSHTCVLRADGSAVRWGDWPTPPPPGVFARFSCGLRTSCTISNQSGADCWVWAGDEVPFPGAFASVSAGAFDACGVLRDGTVACSDENFSTAK